jgi:hypothetical protein
MLEVLSADDLALRLGFAGDGEVPDLAPIADAVRRSVIAWGRPARQRVSAYLHRQLQAAGYGEEAAQSRVKLAIDGLLDIGDIVAVRLEGKACLVSALPQIVVIGASDSVLLGDSGGPPSTLPSMKPAGNEPANRLARHVIVPDGEGFEGVNRIDFDAWIGPGAFLAHLRRRSGNAVPVALADFWAYVSGVIEREGAPIEVQHVRALVHPPSYRDGFFGHHNRPGSEGRWSAAVPSGIWCAVRVGRNANEWHPILIDTRGDHARAIDCYDWDEWSWALRARGVAMGEPERIAVSGYTVQFQQPIPLQFQRALRLLGGAGARAWSWDLSAEAQARFRAFCAHLG